MTNRFGTNLKGPSCLTCSGKNKALYIMTQPHCFSPSADNKKYTEDYYDLFSPDVTFGHDKHLRAPLEWNENTSASTE